MLILMCDGVDMQLLGIVAPVVITDFAVDKGAFGIAMSAALIGMAVGAWFGGWIGDMIGRRYSLALAALAFGLATIVASTAHDVWTMAGWRLLGGLGFGSAFSNALAMGSEWLPKRWQPLAITALSVGTPAGGAVAGLLVPLLLADLGWRGTFVVFGAATLTLVLLILALLRDSPSFLLSKGKRDEAMRAAQRAGSDIEFAPERRASEGDGQPAIGVLHRSNFRLNLGVGAGFTAATLVAYGILNWTTTIFTAKGIALSMASYAISVAGMTSIAGSLMAGVAIRRIGSRAVMLTASGLLAVNLLALAGLLEVLPSHPSDSEILGAIILIGSAAALFSCSIATIYVIITLGYPQSCRSAGIGFGISMGRIGAILASGFGGLLLELGSGSTLPFFAILVAGAMLIAVAARIIDRHVAVT
jgi:AAHS family 4-hydroxybenzoate transporter-like MFS transporter